MNLLDLQEQFNNVLPIQYGESDDEYFYAEFAIAPDDVVKVTIEADGDPAVWDVSFTRGKANSMGKHQITKEGNANIVFATVMEVMKQFVRQKQPEFISFSSHMNEPSRAKLYTSMIIRYAGTLGMTRSTDPANDPSVPEHFRRHYQFSTKYQTVFLLKRA